jgi:hypothetical protein
MNLQLTRTSGKYQYNAIVGCQNPKTHERTRQHVTVFADDRDMAIAAAVRVVTEFGYKNCSINHITKIG